MVRLPTHVDDHRVLALHCVDEGSQSCDECEEARRSIGAGNYNAAVMLGRKLLTNIAVTRGAPRHRSFKSYVECLQAEGIVTGEMKDRVDEIREQQAERSSVGRCSVGAESRALAPDICTRPERVA